VTPAALRAAPERVEQLVQEGCAVAIAARGELAGSMPTDAVRACPLAADTPQAWDAFLDEVVLAFGGLDLLVCGKEEKHATERSAALLALSPVGGRVEHAGATVQAVG
jgi:hypothetical protein